MNLEEKLNEFLADLNVFYRKLQNYHWNVQGKDFFQTHKKLEELYDEVNESVDEIAEHILILGGQPLGTLKDYLAVATIEEALKIRQAGITEKEAKVLMLSSTAIKEDIEKLEEILKESNEKGQIIPIKSVGVQGDCRSYRNLGLLYGNGTDLEWDKVTTLAKKITDKINTINRVGYILNVKNVQSQIKCFDMKINDECVDLLRELDSIVTTNLEGSKVNQTFAVLVPIGISKKYSVAIRTFVTNDFMTGKPGEIGTEVDRKVIEKTVKEIEEKFSDKIEFIIYDVTSKPPATCEWQ